MKLGNALLLASFLAQNTSAIANSPSPIPVPVERQLIGLTVEEAESLISKLEIAQERLRAGEFQSFELLAGSVASYDQTKISPRDAFLSIPFQEVWDIRRVATDSSLRQPFRLSYAPNGLGQLYWDIEVAVGFSGHIESVKMTYKVPAPF
tara:strand:+ start:1393 stop:1842 length:450 start_codon:yes stop_codon:yes gene_type:complete